MSMYRMILAASVIVGLTVQTVSVESAEIDREKVKRSVTRGLDWLAAQQSTQGHWTANDGNYPTAMTALAGMAFLCEGSTTTGRCVIS